jgi:choline dehydrogenase-like flavoprotein
MSFTFTEQQRKTLEVICDTLIPELAPESGDDLAVFQNNAGLYPLVDRLQEQLARAPNAKQVAVCRLLTAINIPVVCWYWTQSLTPFRYLSLENRVKTLIYWRDHRNGRLRSFFQMLKRHTLFHSYSDPEHNGPDGKPTNRTWASMKYSGMTPQMAQPEDALTFRNASLSSYAEEIECDYLVIGSGAGGSVMAAELAERGYKILVVEKGELVKTEDYGNSEAEGISRFYDGSGTTTTDDLGVSILAGSTVGGGTTVNWMTCLDPPPEIMKLWAEHFGFRGVAQDRFQASLYAVRQRLNVTSAHSQLNLQNRKLLDGCRHFGFASSRIERNAKDCGDCGYCGFGCRAGAKQDARQTYLVDACRLGVELLHGCEVKSLVRDGSTATHALAQMKDEDGERRNLKIKFRAAVVACGAIHTPALLLRSGFMNPHIGQNLKLHPATAVAAYYDEPIMAWQGAPQTIVCDEFANLDGMHHGVRLEVAPVHPGFGAMALAWKNPQHHKRLMQSLHRMANTIVIARDTGTGKVTLDKRGQPKIEYTLNRADEEHLLFGAERAIEMHRAVGAKRILGPHHSALEFDNQMTDKEFNRRLNRMHQLGGAPNRLGLYSAHQMSTARMADSPLRGAVDRKGRCYDAQNVFVCDASIFPTSIGVNPMITVMTVSHMLAQTIRDDGFSVYDF